MTLEQLRNFRQLGAITAGHPEYGHAKGIETTIPGPLGQGPCQRGGLLPWPRNSCAPNGARRSSTTTLVHRRPDGCLMEGVSQEAIGARGRQELFAP